MGTCLVLEEKIQSMSRDSHQLFGTVHQKLDILLDTDGINGLSPQIDTIKEDQCTDMVDLSCLHGC